MSYIQLDEDLLVQMYEDPDITIKAIQKHFGVSSGVIYRHLKAKGVDPNRKTLIPWTNQEDADLIAARKEGLTGAEMYERIPTRSKISIRLHVQKLRLLKKIR
jgi:transposase-like protein